jgi:hypothetical protein
MRSCGVRPVRGSADSEFHGALESGIAVIFGGRQFLFQGRDVIVKRDERRHDGEYQHDHAEHDANSL